MNKYNQITSIPDIISELSLRFARHERYDELEEIVDRLIAIRLADLRAKRTQEAISLVLTAPTGSGKTTAMKKLVSKANEKLKQSDFPEGKILRVTVPASATLKSLGYRILKELGIDLKSDRRNWYVWDLVEFHLRENKILFVNLDEAQQLKGHRRQHELFDIVSTIKEISQHDHWPVGFLLSGTEVLKEIINIDRQLVRRMKAVNFDDLSPATDTWDILSLIGSYAEMASLGFNLADTQLDFGKRVLHAVCYQFGLVIKLTLFAIEVALYAEAADLEDVHFAQGFKNWKGCTDAYNPFFAKDYLQIDTQLMFTSEELI